MRRLAPSFVLWILGCATPAPPSPLPLPPPAAVAVAAPSTAPREPAIAAPSPPPALPLAELPPAPVLPLHRFAALVPGQVATLFAVEGRVILRAGMRLFSLSPGQAHREAALEKALSMTPGVLNFGALGGRYPDDLLADRRASVPGKTSTVRQYVRIARARKTTELGRARNGVMATESLSAVQIAGLPDDRLVALLEADGSEGSTLPFLEIVPGPRSDREKGLQGVENSSWRRPLLLPRADGSLVLAFGADEKKLRFFRWTRGTADPAETSLALEPREGASQLFETTGGELFLLTDKALYRQIGAEWRREDAGATVRKAWPLPDGAALLVTEAGDPLVRDATGAVNRARWPVVTIEGRQLPVTFVDAVCTRASGFWAIAADGMGLYHDRAPRELVDLPALAPDAPGRSAP